VRKDLLIDVRVISYNCCIWWS